MSSKDVCSICTEPLNNGLKLTEPSCKHQFHKTCLNTYINSNGNNVTCCPNCRAMIHKPLVNIIKDFIINYYLIIKDFIIKYYLIFLVFFIILIIGICMFFTPSDIHSHKNTIHGFVYNSEIYNLTNTYIVDITFAYDHYNKLCTLYPQYVFDTYLEAEKLLNVFIIGENINFYEKHTGVCQLT
jgi:hypothetical protein